jgi:hypothetical protein
LDDRADTTNSGIGAIVRLGITHLFYIEPGALLVAPVRVWLPGGSLCPML